MRAITLFILSIALTAIFSYSLNVFLKEDYTTLTLKTMLVPCFTWTVLILFAYAKLQYVRFTNYALIATIVCVSGSAILVPCGIYNFMATKPDIILSIISVLASVIVMSALFYVLLTKNGYSQKWWWAYNILICINMTLFYFISGS